MNVFLSLTSILILGFSLISGQVYAASNTYYVTQNGEGAKDGKNSSSAWSISDFNSSANWSTVDNPNKIDPGDTVYFSGKITSQIAPPSGYGGSGGKYVTLDGWKDGTCNPVKDRSCDSAAVVDMPSRTNSGSNWCIYSIDNSYLIIQDFNLQDSHGGIFASGPNSGSPSTHLTVRRNYIHNMEGRGTQLTALNGIGINYITYGGVLGDGNYVYDTVEDSKTNYSDSHCVGFANTDDLVVSYNLITNSFQDLSDASNTVSIHTGNRILFEYNTLGNPSGQACLALKEFGGNQKIVRFNKFYGCGQQGGVAVVTDRAPQKDFYIYGNLVYNSAGGIWLYRNYDNMYIWSNVIHDIKEEKGTGQGGYAMDISTGGEPGDVYVYNNTIARGGIDSDPGMRITGASAQQVRVKNNIFYYNNSNDGNIQLFVQSGDEKNLVSLGYDTYYTSGTPYVYYYGEKRTIATMQSVYNFENDAVPGKVENPGFVDPNGADNVFGTEDDDYTLDGTHIDDGEDLSQCFDVSVQGRNYHMCYDDALDPAGTNWKTTPPTVRTVKQGSYGSWDRGAYVYTGDAPSPQELSPPSQLKIITTPTN